MRRLIEERDRLLELLKRNEQEREALARLVLNEAVALTGGIPTPPRVNFDQGATGTMTGSTTTPPWRANAHNMQGQQQRQQQEVSDSSPESSKFVTPSEGGFQWDRCPDAGLHDDLASAAFTERVSVVFGLAGVSGLRLGFLVPAIFERPA